MSAPRVYTWPVADADGVALLQTLGAAGSLALDGALSNAVNNGLFVDFGDVNRVVTLTSTNNLSAVNFTIVGTLNGVAVTETRVGPNNNTVATTQVYSEITSITASAAATAVSAGTGTTGHTKWFMSNRYIPNTQLAIQADVTATLDYSFQTTLDDVNNNNSPFISTPISAMTTATTDQLGVLTVPFMFCRVLVNSSNGTGALTVTMLQQGIVE